jgi:hypothetical protein
MVAHLRTFRGRKVTRQETSGMVSHLRMFCAVMDSSCRMPPPLECCVRSDELTVPMRMHFCLPRAANVRARAYAHGHVCARARA